MIKKILSCAGEYKKPSIFAAITVVGEVIMEIFIPMIMANIINNGINGTLPDAERIAYVTKMGLFMIALALISLTFGALSGRLAAVGAMGFAKNVRKKLFNKVQDFSFANVDKFSTASLVTRLTTDVTNAQMSYMMLIRIFVRAPIMLVFATTFAFIMNAELARTFLVAVPVLAIAFIVIGKVAFPRFSKFLAKYDGLNANVQENLVGIRAVKAFVRENHETEKFRKAADEVRKAQYRAESAVIFGMPIMQLVIYGCMLAVYWFGGNLIIGGKMLTGDLVGFITYVMQILMSMMMLSMIFITFILSKASIQRIVEVFDEETDIADVKDGIESVSDGSIEFKNVDFSYAKDKDNLTVENVNFSIKSGETVGIIGGTGSSKTTLVQLIPRLYDVLDGEIIVGGHDVREYKISALRNQVAMVLQKNVLFSGTIKENLKWGNENATDEEVIEACKSAQAHDFIMSFPDGYETYLGQGGVNVSGGQKQRLCIARALLKKPKIIILDDSTSAVDTATDSKIRSAFKEKLAGTTAIIIAQRISSVSDADKIIVLDDGKINAVGTHEELLKTNEIYREVYQSQQKGA